MGSTIQTECLAGTEDRHPVFPVKRHLAFAVNLPVVLGAMGQGTGFLIDSHQHAVRQHFLNNGHPAPANGFVMRE